MTRLLTILFVFAVGFINAQAFTKASNSDIIKKKIKSKTTSTQSIQGTFQEETFSSMFATSKKAKGILLFEKENKIRWEHTSPKSQVVLINGKSIRFQENGKEITNSNSNRIVKKVQQLMLQLFSGDFLNEKDFSVSYYESKSQYKLTLKPKSSRMSKYIKKVHMVFNKKTLSLESMVLEESETDKVVYSFNSVIFDRPISDSKFQHF